MDQEPTPDLAMKESDSSANEVYIQANRHSSKTHEGARSDILEAGNLPAGKLLSINRWAYDPSGRGFVVRPDMTLDLRPNRPNQVPRHVVDGKSSMNAAASSDSQFSLTSRYLETSFIKAATPLGLWTWPGAIKKGK
ncbi:hypothetical protein [Herbaspirillum rubrisubalbicans]|uniref:hypothetical protein n=1 Tax=Herbaspirillum rubrisubalbicans TaxID=80842 RepID=UPI0011D28B93|nr:hypothetical protein [Herbaspirillum rubrisubalbicans]